LFNDTAIGRRIDPSGHHRPKQSGKSTYLRQTALIVLMAQTAHLCPPKKPTSAWWIASLPARRQDILHAGQSTFGGDGGSSNILHHATRSCCLFWTRLDAAPAPTTGCQSPGQWWVHYNHPALRAPTLFATHYHELTELAHLLQL
jgi:DNA mismatch repair protein MutS